jgi:hypothetical protein
MRPECLWRLVAFHSVLLACSSQAGVEITVQTYNGADIPSEVLTAAQNEAARIFRAAGIVVVWLECSVCAKPCPPGRLDLRIVAGVLSGDERTTVGVATPSGEGAGYLTVFYPRVLEFAKEGIATRQQILSHVIAHEIGHQLLGSKPHAAFGIMRGQWDVHDLRAAAMGALLFSSREAALMRGAVARRGCRQD